MTTIPEPKRYVVYWAIEIETDDPVDAARKARYYLLNSPNGQRFRVDAPDGTHHNVDLLKEFYTRNA